MIERHLDRDPSFSEVEAPSLLVPILGILENRRFEGPTTHCEAMLEQTIDVSADALGRHSMRFEGLDEVLIRNRQNCIFQTEEVRPELGTLEDGLSMSKRVRQEVHGRTLVRGCSTGEDGLAYASPRQSDPNRYLLEVASRKAIPK